MIKYICKSCNDLETETSTCPVCGKRTSLLSSEIFYCDKCNAPSFTEECQECHSVCNKIGSDLRPVFAQERLLLEVLLDKPMAFAGKSVWSTSSNMYWIEGAKLRVNMAEMRKQDPAHIISELQKYKDDNAKYVEEDTSNEHIKSFIRSIICFDFIK